MSDSPSETVHQPKPKGFKSHSFDFSFKLDNDREKVWEYLNAKETFTQGQPFPYRVEFLSPSGEDCGFEQGVYCAHHGPLMLFAGVIGEMQRPKYRDLPYLYGSYAISLRFIRPTRLQFWLEEEGEGTRVKLRVDSFVHPAWSALWTFGQSIFWRFFPMSCRRGLQSFKS